MTTTAFPGFWIDTESGFLTHDTERQPSERHVPLTRTTAAEYGISDDLLAILTARQETTP